jgi:ABC-2 type transport system permease protein
MGPWWQLVRKNISESRSFLVLSAIPLFCLSWLFVFLTKSFEKELLSNPFGQDILRRVMENLGLEDMEYSTVAFTMASWTHPILLLILCLWAISRGSLAVSGELERGTLDMQLTRPVTRNAYLSSHVFVAIVGFVLLAIDLLCGYYLGVTVNKVPNMPSIWVLLRPATNYAAIGLALFSMTLAVSAVSVTRRTPNLFASCFAVSMFLLYVIPIQRGLRQYRYLSNYSFFHTFRPGHVVLKGTEYGRDMAILLSISLVGCVVAYCGFRWRDLPSNT